MSRASSLLPARRDLLLAGLVGSSALALTGVHADALGRPLAPVHAVLVGVGALALAGRRRWPVATLAVTVAAVLPGYALGAVSGPAMGVVAVAVYTVATRVRWPSAVGVGALLVAVWAGGEALGGRFDHATLAGDPLPWVALSVAVGVAVGATRRARAARAAHDEEQRRLGVERERLRMAREVHDVVSHSLALINVQAGVAVHVADRRPEQALAALRAIREASHVALDDLRGVVAALRDPHDGDPDDGEPTSPAGPGLHRLAEVVRAGEAAGLDVAVRGVPGALPPPVDRAAFRIVQEAVTNAVRHARDARRLTIELDRRDGLLVLRVGDDGRTRGPGPSRQGLRGMTERASALGGSAQAGPTGTGFLVVAELPLEPVE